MYKIILSLLILTGNVWAYTPTEKYILSKTIEKNSELLKVEVLSGYYPIQGDLNDAPAFLEKCTFDQKKRKLFCSIINEVKEQIVNREVKEFGKNSHFSTLSHLLFSHTIEGWSNSIFGDNGELPALLERYDDQIYWKIGAIQPLYLLKDEFNVSRVITQVEQKYVVDLSHYKNIGNYYYPLEIKISTLTEPVMMVKVHQISVWKLKEKPPYTYEYKNIQQTLGWSNSKIIENSEKYLSVIR